MRVYRLSFICYKECYISVVKKWLSFGLEKHMEQTNQAIKAIAPNVQVLQAAGISTPENVLAALQSGADGTGGTSGIVCAKNPEKILTEMLQVIADYRGGKR